MLLFAMLTMLVSSPAVADYVMTTTNGYGNLDIPYWMQGPVWVTFEYEGFEYSLVHVFTDDYKDPYIQVSQEKDENGASEPNLLRLIINILRGEWPTKKGEWYNKNDDNWDSPEEFYYSNRGDDICRSFELETRWEVSHGGRSYFSKLEELCTYTYANFDNVQVKVYLKDRLPDWIKDCAPFTIEDN